MGRNLREWGWLPAFGVTCLSRFSCRGAQRTADSLVSVCFLVVASIVLSSADGHAQESTGVRPVAAPEPAPDRSVEVGLGLRWGGSTKATLVGLALDVYVPRYFVGLRAEAAGSIDLFGGGNREGVQLVSLGVARQLPIPSTNLSLSLFAGPALGSMTLDWRPSGLLDFDNHEVIEPPHNPALGTYLVYGAQVAASLSIHIGGFLIGFSGSASVLLVDGTEHLTGLYGSRFGFSM